MDSSDLAMLLGLVGGGAGAYFGGQRRRERERADKKQDMLDSAELQRQLLRDEITFKKELEAEEKAAAEKYDAEHFDLWDDTVDLFTDPFKSYEYGKPVNPDSSTFIPLPGNPFNDPRQNDPFWGLDLIPGTSFEWDQQSKDMWSNAPARNPDMFKNQGGRIEYNQGGIVDLYRRMNRG